MSARDETLRRLAMSFGEYDEARDNALLDAHRAEVRAETLREAAEALTFHKATSLFDAINNILLRYGFYNPANSVPETEKVFGLFREHLHRMAEEGEGE